MGLCCLLFACCSTTALAQSASWLHGGCWRPFRWPPTTPPANRPSLPPCSPQVPCPLPDCKAPISAAECGLVLTPEEAATLGKVGGAAGASVG